MMAGRPRATSCDVCGKPCKTVFDHDHITGKFRGWLCPHCNSALGHALDNPAILEALRMYVIKFWFIEEVNKNLERKIPQISNY